MKRGIPGRERAGPRDRQIGQRLKVVRKEIGLSQTEFARQILITRERLANYEAGRTVLPTGLSLRLCHNFIIGEEWLATGRGSSRRCLDVISEPEFRYIDTEAPFRTVFDESLSNVATRFKDIDTYAHLDRLVRLTSKGWQRSRNLLQYMLWLDDPEELEEGDWEELHPLYALLVQTCYRYMAAQVGGEAAIAAARLKRQEGARITERIGSLTIGVRPLPHEPGIVRPQISAPGARKKNVTAIDREEEVLIALANEAPRAGVSELNLVGPAIPMHQAHKPKKRREK